MANERAFTTRNVGTKSSPIWEKWFAKTVADAVMISDDPAETVNIKQYVDKKLADLVGTTPENLDTLQEIANWIRNNEEFTEKLNDAILNKSDKDHIHPDATISYSGFMSKEDKDKLNGIEYYANAYIHPETHDADMIVEDMNHRFVSDADKASWNNAIVYTNSNPTVNALGGVEAGSTFDNVSITDMITKILYPYVAPVVTTSITAPSNGGVREKGNNQTVTKIRVNVTRKSSSITKIEILDGSTVIAERTDGVSNGGTFDFDVNVVVSSNKYFQAKVYDSDNKTTTANTGTFSFVYPYYTGVMNTGVALTESTIEALTKKVESKGTKGYTFTANNQRCVLAYPKSYGVIKLIKDPNNFDVTSTFSSSTVSITGLDGIAVDYYVYINEASTVSSFKFTFSY